MGIYIARVLVFERPKQFLEIGFLHERLSLYNEIDVLAKLGVKFRICL